MVLRVEKKGNNNHEEEKISQALIGNAYQAYKHVSITQFLIWCRIVT